ncbi:MAG: hypothetical protein JSU75_06645 [Gammaproteobacteria bacterium]|nr:MAG: hypothetical protein JSU75_06645 [Gammaproteobacteria bacterium]
MQQNLPLADRILDTALAIAENGSWEDLQLHAVAANLDIPLERIREYYAQKDDLAEAWFDRADRRLLSWQPEAEFYEQPEYTRLRQVIMHWLEALEPHHRITREMLYYKLEPGHIHLQALGVMRISRTVQWFREMARLQASSLKRIVEETVVTGIYLASFGRWLLDDSPHRSDNTESFMARALGCLQRRDSARNNGPERKPDPPA